MVSSAAAETIFLRHIRKLLVLLAVLASFDQSANLLEWNVSYVLLWTTAKMLFATIVLLITLLYIFLLKRNVVRFLLKQNQVWVYILASCGLRVCNYYLITASTNILYLTVTAYYDGVFLLAYCVVPFVDAIPVSLGRVTTRVISIVIVVAEGGNLIRRTLDPSVLQDAARLEYWQRSSKGELHMVLSTIDGLQFFGFVIIILNLEIVCRTFLSTEFAIIARDRVVFDNLSRIDTPWFTRSVCSKVFGENFGSWFCQRFVRSIFTKCLFWSSALVAFSFYTGRYFSNLNSTQLGYFSSLVLGLHLFLVGVGSLLCMQVDILQKLVRNPEVWHLEICCLAEVIINIWIWGRVDCRGGMIFSHSGFWFAATVIPLGDALPGVLRKSPLGKSAFVAMSLFRFYVFFLTKITTANTFSTYDVPILQVGGFEVLSLVVVP